MLPQTNFIKGMYCEFLQNALKKCKLIHSKIFLKTFSQLFNAEGKLIMQ